MDAGRNKRMKGRKTGIKLRRGWEKNVRAMYEREKETQAPYWMEKQEGEARLKGSAEDFLLSLGIWLAVTALSWFFYLLGLSDATFVAMYLLGVVAVSIKTAHRVYSLAASVAGVISVNFFFIEPRFTLFTYDREDLVTFLVMLTVALITGSLAARLKDHVRDSALAAFRARILFETGQLLMKAGTKKRIVKAAAEQAVKMLNRDVAVFLAEDGQLGKAELFAAESGRPADGNSAVWCPDPETAARTFLWGRAGDFFQDLGSGTGDTYAAIRNQSTVYGVMAVRTRERALDAFESSILLSLLAECALALESEKNAREKEEAAVAAENERLRSNLLRSISHDLRTPLTSISGNASNLLGNSGKFDEKTKLRLYADIYEDSVWLIKTVENLLAVTRIEQGKVDIHMNAELVEEVAEEALRHVSRQAGEHTVHVEYGEDFLLARMDARLIVQVLVNLLDNAIKYTPKGSHIRIRAERAGSQVRICVADDGPGIPDEEKGHVFDMFYTGGDQGGDGRRSTGLGLYLCRAIIEAHGGEITLSDNAPHGAVFTFTLPREEVVLHE